MTNITHALQEVLKKQLDQTNYDVAGIVALPTHCDRMVRMRTLEEILNEFDETSNDGTIQYLLQIKPRSAVSNATHVTPQIAVPNPAPEGIYHANGKLNTVYLVKNADLLFESGEYALARTIYKTVLQSGEHTGAALYRMGRCYEAEDRLEDATISFEESIAYHPSLDTYQRLATLLIRQSKDQQGAEVIERALNLKDLSQAVRLELHKAAGNCWVRALKFDESERNFKKALEINPSGDEIRSNLGVLYLQSNKVNEAKRHFQDAVASNPRNHLALAGIGSCYLAEGDKKTAYDYFVKSLEIEVRNATAIFYLVKCAYELKSYAKAATILEAYIQISPVNANLLYSLAGLQFHLGRMGEAESTVQKILEIQPQHTGARDLAGMIAKYTDASK